MKTFNFTIVLLNMDFNNSEHHDSLFENGCDDALVYMENDVVFLDFTREATTQLAAESSAILDIKNADFNGICLGSNETTIHIFKTNLKMQKTMDKLSSQSTNSNSLTFLEDWSLKDFKHV